MGMSDMGSESKRDITLKVRVTAEEREVFRRRALAAGMSVGTWMRLTLALSDVGSGVWMNRAVDAGSERGADPEAGRLPPEGGRGDIGGKEEDPPERRRASTPSR